MRAYPRRAWPDVLSERSRQRGGPSGGVRSRAANAAPGASPPACCLRSQRACVSRNRPVRADGESGRQNGAARAAIFFHSDWRRRPVPLLIPRSTTPSASAAAGCLACRRSYSAAFGRHHMVGLQISKGGRVREGVPPDWGQGRKPRRDEVANSFTACDGTPAVLDQLPHARVRSARARAPRVSAKPSAWTARVRGGVGGGLEHA